MPKYRIEALPNGYVEVDSEREEWPEYICIVYRNEVSGKTIYFDYTRMTQGYVNDFEVNSDLYFYGVSVARPLNSGATYAMNAPMPLMIAQAIQMRLSQSHA